MGSGSIFSLNANKNGFQKNHIPPRGSFTDNRSLYEMTANFRLDNRPSLLISSENSSFSSETRNFRSFLFWSFTPHASRRICSDDTGSMLPKPCRDASSLAESFESDRVCADGLLRIDFEDDPGQTSRIGSSASDSLSGPGRRKRRKRRRGLQRRCGFSDDNIEVSIKSFPVLPPPAWGVQQTLCTKTNLTLSTIISQCVALASPIHFIHHLWRRRI